MVLNFAKLFFFCCKMQLFGLEMEYYFIHMVILLLFCLQWKSSNHDCFFSHAPSNNDDRILTSNKPTHYLLDSGQICNFFIHRTTVGTSFDRSSFCVLFRVYEDVSWQWHHKRWPSNAQLSLVCWHNTFLQRRPIANSF